MFAQRKTLDADSDGSEPARSASERRLDRNERDRIIFEGPREMGERHVDVPVVWSWAKRDTYDKEMVDAAIGTLAK